MGKIRNFLVGKMIRLKLTSKEIDFMLFIFHLQDNAGNVCGLYYKDLCKRMHMSIQGFYNVLKSLERKGVISRSKSDYVDHDIKILDNTFRNEEERSEGYVPANYNLFFDEEFYKLKAGAKLLAIHLLKICGAGKGYHEIGVQKFYENYPRDFGVSERVMRTYLMQLKPFFSIGIKNGKYYMTPRAEIFRRDKIERESFAEHTVNSICRRNHVKEIAPEEKKIIGKLIWQYEGVAVNIGKTLTDVAGALRTASEKCVTILETGIEILNEGQEKVKKSLLNAKLIHTLLRVELGISDTIMPVMTSDPDQAKAFKAKFHRSEDRKPPSKKDKFNNFPQRQYDYDELEKMLLNTIPANE